MDVTAAFVLLGAIIFIGFLGSLLFTRTNIPDVLILIGIGALVGPVLGWISPTVIMPILPFFSTLALIVILFEGGMDLDLDRVVGQFPVACFQGTLAFGLGVVGVALIFHVVTDAGWLISLLLGSVLGCVSGAIVIPIVSRMAIPKETKTLVTIEAAISDVLAVVVTIVFAEMLASGNGETDYGKSVHSLASAFSIGIVAAVIGGLLWVRIFNLVQGKPFSFMITLAMLFMLYGGVEAMGGSGAMAALIFGLVMTNADRITAVFGRAITPMLDEKFRLFQSEITFFLRTFFFVALGILFDPNAITVEALPLYFGLFCMIVLSRYFSILAVGWLSPIQRSSRFFSWSMMPRGLTSAVLALIPVSQQIAGSDRFLELTFVTIVLTNVFMTVGLFAVRRRPTGAPAIAAGIESNVPASGPRDLT